jgi:uncharacterized membrane protein YhaH (DUF805 family)
MDWGHLLFGFNGRINRAKYWLWVLLYIIVAIVVAIIVYVIESNISIIVGGILQFAFGIAAFVSSLAVMVKRLHDRNKSAMWLLVFVLAPMILLGIGLGSIIYGAFTGGGSELGGVGLVGGIFTAAGVAVMLWAFVEIACLRGTVGANPYGTDPLEGRLGASPSR